MQLSEATRKKIRELLKEKKMKPYDLCKASGIAPSIFSDFMNGHTKHVRIDTLLHICEGFNVSLAEFFSDKLFKDVISE